MPKAELISSGEACRILGIERSTLVRWVQLKRHIKPALKLAGPNGAYLYRRRDIEALAAARDDESVAG